ncbi:T6SS effector amidase Tae4 family protein [Nitrobacter sp. JJSN]|uniref:T6SS effector amidase Tae4 family protein n=1 Tax=Nitrobacter sp. JJSN TaxID=3453033 RepID=UPI003F767A02
MALTFNGLSSNYPTAPKPDLFISLGGDWPGLIDDPNYENTCCIRLSLAILAAGGDISRTYREAIAGDGRPLIVKVATMGNYLKGTLGQIYWGMSKNPGTMIDAETLPRQAGIVVYHVAWANATGHFDLWTGSNFVGAGNFADIGDGFDVALWKIN